MSSRRTSIRLLLPLLGLAALSASSHAGPQGDVVKAGPKQVVQLPIRTDGPKSLDPVEGSTTYDNMACVQVYETLLEVDYRNPRTWRPLLVESAPERLDGGKRWRFHLRKGVLFHDDPCFPGGVGRELVTDDVFYSWKRLADAKYTFKNWWLLENTIAGFDEFKETQNGPDGLNYDAPVEGFVKIDDHTFEIVLKEPVYRFIWVLTMFQTSIVPREAVEQYGKDFSRNPVGTGPFVFDAWSPKQHLFYDRNPKYRTDLYPGDGWSEADREIGMHEAAGAKLPIPDRLEFTMFVEDQPMWLKFNSNKLAYTEVPAEYFQEAFNKRNRKLKREFKRKGVLGFENPLLDFIFIGFNMEDPVLGGYTPEKKALRHALSLALDWDERNDTFYNSKNLIYDGPIPPTLDGHPEDGRAGKWRGLDLERARQQLAAAGYPNGEGLPPIKYYTNRGGNNAEQAELLKRQLGAIGVKLEPQFVDFSTLIDNVNNKKAPLFSFAWSSDYPDGENNLALFYGPYESPGSNHYNYKNAEYDALYEKIRVMEPSAERTAIYERMRDMVIEDTPYLGAMARRRHYLVAPWAENCRPTERFWSWFKYVGVDESER
jgi:ABC-type transport system substrate-binding protein